jgi:sec-independent protein translocase protein TatA
MLGLGPEEILLILVVILVFFGATKLPELARSMGQSMGEFKVGQLEAEKKYEIAKSQLSQQPVQTPDDIALTRAQRMAKNLGVDIKGKSDEQLLAEIENKLAAQDAASKK